MTPHPVAAAPNPPPQNHLYRNNGNGTFTDVTEKAGLDPDLYSVGVTAADYDNDGYEDLLVTGYGRVILYHNNGNGHFTDVTEKAGHQSGWMVDQLDVAGLRPRRLRGLVCWPLCEVRSQLPRLTTLRITIPGPLDYEGETNRLFHNNCDGTFTDVTEKSGIGASIGRTMGVTAADFDGDGWDGHLRCQ